MGVIVARAEAAVSPESLDSLESRLHIRLPGSYRAWLLKANGGRPTPNRFRYKRESGPYTDSLVDWFYAVYKGPNANFEWTFESLKIHQNRLPENLVGIADDPFGNVICLSMKGDDFGKVFFWDHEGEGDAPTYQNCYLIADNFDEFIERLF